MKVRVEFENEGYPSGPISGEVFPIPDTVGTLHINGLGMGTVFIQVPRPAPKRVVRKRGWVNRGDIYPNAPLHGNNIEISYEVEE
jgi:hypothetical protein